LLVEFDDSRRKQIVAVLSDASYEVSTDPPQLACRDLHSEIKGFGHTHNPELTDV
jgi:hypothetical protein